MAKEQTTKKTKTTNAKTTAKAKAKTTAKKTKEIQDTSLETVLYNCRVQLRGTGTNEANRDAVITLIFLKFAGLRFAERYRELETEHGNTVLEDPVFYRAGSVFYLPRVARWSYLLAHAADDDIAVLLDTALVEIEEANPDLKGALQRNLYVSLAVSRAKLKALLDAVDQIDPRRFHEEDLIGRVYEYFLRIYAAAGTKEDGEFYTPASIVELIAELIEPYEGIVYEQAVA